MSDFLLELQVEELPPKPLISFVTNLKNNLAFELIKNHIPYDTIIEFATPRRLALLVKKLATNSNTKSIDKKGPSVDSHHKAIMGFAKNCNVKIEELAIKKTQKGEYYYYTKTVTGINTKDNIINICANAISNMKITRPMRWGNNKFSFIRPVHSIIALFNDEVINGKIFGITTGNTTKGLRFVDDKIVIDNATNYRSIMLKNNIEVDYIKRKKYITHKINDLAKKNQVIIVDNQNLIDEVTALVENPKEFIGNFNQEYLNLPIEVVMSFMNVHQKYFTVTDHNNKLVNKFIAVSNNDKNDMSVIISGNEKVIDSRLSDANFFYNQDQKTTLRQKAKKLSTVSFIENLGSMFAKTKRVTKLSVALAKINGANPELTERAAMLCKADLVSDMVNEFSELQGIMGYYYALKDKEHSIVATAIKEQYYPKFADDKLPISKEGIALSFADKMDTICGIFLLGKQPTQSKDPFALRRLALGLMRLIIESKMNVNLLELITLSIKMYKQKYDDNLIKQIYNFMLERLKHYYAQKNITTKVVNSVTTSNDNPYDLHQKILALHKFIDTNDAKKLIATHKRVSNILKDFSFQQIAINNLELTLDIEKKLHKKIKQITITNYDKLIVELVELGSMLDEFFDNVVINDKDKHKRINRLNLVLITHKLFISMADFNKLS